MSLGALIVKVKGLAKFRVYVPIVSIVVPFLWSNQFCVLQSYTVTPKRHCNGDYRQDSSVGLRASRLGDLVAWRPTLPQRWLVLDGLSQKSHAFTTQPLHPESTTLVLTPRSSMHQLRAINTG